MFVYFVNVLLLRLQPAKAQTRPLRQPSRAFQPQDLYKRLSASVAQRRAFSQCCAAQGFQPVQSHGVVPSLSLVPSTSVPRMQASLTSTRSTASWPSEGFADSATEVS